MLDLLAAFVSLFVIIGFFMAVQAVQASRDRLRPISRILMRWSSNVHPELFAGLEPSPLTVSLQDGQKGSMKINGELFDFTAKGTINAGDHVTIGGVSGRVSVIEKAKA